MAKKKITTEDVATEEIAKEEIVKEEIITEVAKDVTKDVTKKTIRVRIPMDVFLNAYKAGETYEDIAKVLGVKVTTVQQRVYSYKKKGVNIIPKSNGTRGAKPLDIERANAILAE